MLLGLGRFVVGRMGGLRCNVVEKYIRKSRRGVLANCTQCTAREKIILD